MPPHRDDNGRPVGIEVITEPEVRGTTMGGIYYANDWADEGGLLLVAASPSAHAERITDDVLADRLQADAESLHPELAGDHMTAPWVEGAIRNGQLAAQRITATLAKG